MDAGRGEGDRPGGAGIALSRNLRHLRAFREAAETGSMTRAAARAGVTQPAVTQAVRRLEAGAGGALFDRRSGGLFPTARGRVLARRVARALALLDPALREVSPRLAVTVTARQLEALVAVAEAQSFTLAAHRLGLAQPTVHRAVAQIEREAGRPLFDRVSFGVIAARGTRALAQAARLAFAEIGQAEAELAELSGAEAGHVVIGALPLARAAVLPAALVAFQARRPRQPVTVIDGPYDEMLGGLLRGEIDLILGALREPPPAPGIVQEALFDDRLAVLADPSHPLAGEGAPEIDALSRFPWVVPRQGTPSRAQFDAVFAAHALPSAPIEAGSILLMREVLRRGTHLGCISAAQAAAEIASGLLVALPADPGWPGRPIGIATRAGWEPTAAQSLMIDLIRAAARATAPLSPRPDAGSAAAS